MKLTKFIKSYYQLFFLIGCGIGLYFLTKSSNEYEIELLKNGKLTIGTFKKFHYTKSGHREFEYYFYENGNYRNGGSTFRGKYPDSSQTKLIFEGDRFLVLFDDDGSLILFDHPIKDSIDFTKYVKEFEDTRTTY